MNDEILPITCWGYNFAEQSLARVLAEERSKVGLWYWDEDVQPNKMKKAAPLRAARYSFD